MPGEEPEDEDIAPIIFNYLNNSREKQNRQAHGTEQGSGRDQRGGPIGGLGSGQASHRKQSSGAENPEGFAPA